MRRTHIILACVILVVAIGSGAYLIQPHKHIFKKYEKTNKTDQNPQPIIYPTVVIISGGQTAPNATPEQKATNDDVAYKICIIPQVDSWFRISVISGAIAAIVGVIALGYVWRQLSILVNSERAWIDGNLIYKQSLDFDLDITNHGKTAAHIQNYYIGIGLFNKKGEYEFPYSTSDNIDMLLGSGATHHVPEVKLAALFAEKKVSGKEGVFIRVRIKYWDIVTITDKCPKPRWTTFICVYNRRTNDINRLRGETDYKKAPQQ